MDKIIETLKGWYNQALVWAKANMTIVYIILIGVGVIFVFPKIYKKFFKAKRRIRHRRSVIRRPAIRRHAAGRGKGSLYMRNKMARLRRMRRRKR